MNAPQGIVISSDLVYTLIGLAIVFAAIILLLARSVIQAFFQEKRKHLRILLEPEEKERTNHEKE